MAGANGRVVITAAPGGHSGYALAIGHYLKAGHGVALVFVTVRDAM